MTRRGFVRLAAAAGAGALPAARLLAQTAGSVSERPSGPRAFAFVIDACGGPGDPAAEDGAALSARAIADVRASGITAVNVTVGPVGERPSLAAFEGIFRDLADWEKEIEAHPDALMRVRGASELDAAKSSGRLGLIFGLQDGVAFHDDVSRLEVLHRFGLRIIQPTYNLRNLLGDGCLEPDGAGLSRAGHEAVERMNALRILLDLSHCGRRTTRDGVEASKRPPAFTHTGCASVADHPRNKTDEELRTLAEKGGVAGIYFMPYLRTAGQPMAEDVVRHVERAVQVAGEDHVGIGTDGVISATDLSPEYKAKFRADIERRKKAGIGAPGEVPDVYPLVPDLNMPRRIQRLGELLLARGYSTARVEKIVGGNFARLFREVWG
ncbi:MAG TPA: membrane dipeptidase [Thermoanaerobaculia bacterium]